MVHCCHDISCGTIFRLPHICVYHFFQILFEFCAGVLTFYKGFRHAYALWNAASFPLLHSLLRDGIFFCLIIVALRLCNAFIWVMLPSGSAYLGTSM